MNQLNGAAGATRGGGIDRAVLFAGRYNKPGCGTKRSASNSSGSLAQYTS